MPNNLSNFINGAVKTYMDIGNDVRFVFIRMHG